MSFKVGQLTESLSDHRPVTCKLDLKQHKATIKQQPNYDDAPRRLKWDSKTSPDNFRKECSANKDIVREIEKIHSIKCANQPDVINLNDKFVGIYSLIERNIGTCQSERKPNTNRTLQNTRKTKLKHKWFDSECILRKRELRKAERMYVKKTNGR